MLSLTTTQILWTQILWAGLKAQWGLRCTAKYQKQVPVLDQFIAGWTTVLERWRAARDMSCSRRDIRRFLGHLKQLLG